MPKYYTFRQFSSDGHEAIISCQVMVCIPAPSMCFRVRLFPASVYLNLLSVSSPACCCLLAWIYSNMQAEIERKITNINLIYFTDTTSSKRIKFISSYNSFISWSSVNIPQTLQFRPNSTGL